MITKYRKTSVAAKTAVYPIGPRRVSLFLHLHASSPRIDSRKCAATVQRKLDEPRFVYYYYAYFEIIFFLLQNTRNILLHYAYGCTYQLPIYVIKIEITPTATLLSFHFSNRYCTNTYTTYTLRIFSPLCALFFLFLLPYDIAASFSISRFSLDRNNVDRSVSNVIPIMHDRNVGTCDTIIFKHTER